MARAAAKATTIDTIEAHASMVGHRLTGKHERNSVSRVDLAATCCAIIAAAAAAAMPVPLQASGRATRRLRMKG
jgi:hypothetical protein